MLQPIYGTAAGYVRRMANLRSSFPELSVADSLPPDVATPESLCIL
jgi:hypothetical protein